MGNPKPTEIAATSLRQVPRSLRMSENSRPSMRGLPNYAKYFVYGNNLERKVIKLQNSAQHLAGQREGAAQIARLPCENIRILNEYAYIPGDST